MLDSSITLDQVRQLAPRARDIYLQAFAHAGDALAPYGVLETGLRAAHFMAQVLHETGGLTVLVENLNYTTPERLMAVWPIRFRSIGAAQPYVRAPEALANAVYANRMGNGSPESGDGWAYRGRGLIQLTGRESYARFGAHLGIDLVEYPDLATDPRYSLRIAGAEWDAGGCNAKADDDDVSGITRAINGGLIGLSERREWLARTKQIWC
jgi:putative chitinase